MNCWRLAKGAAIQPEKACAKIDWRSVLILCRCLSISVWKCSGIEWIADSRFNDQLRFNRPKQRDNQRLKHAGVDADDAACRIGLVLDMGSQRMVWQACKQKKVRSSTLWLERNRIRKSVKANCSSASDLIGRLAITTMLPFNRTTKMSPSPRGPLALRNEGIDRKTNLYCSPIQGAASRCGFRTLANNRVATP